MMNGQTFMEWVGLSGLFAIIGSSIAWGDLRHRVESIENHIKADKSQDNAISIARLEEQYKAMQSDITEIKRAVVK